MVSYSRQQAVRWALLLFDNDGCTLIAKTSALEVDDFTKIHPTTTLNFRHGKHNYLAEILAVAGVRRDLNAFELNWQETGRAISIAEAQECGQTDDYLSLQPSESFFKEPVVDVLHEAAKVLEDAADDFDLANLLGTEISNQQIQIEMETLKTNQQRIIDNQQKMMASMTQFMEMQTATADNVSDINGFLKSKLKKAERVEIPIQQIVVPVLDPPMEPSTVVYDKPSSTLAEAILPEGQMNYPEAHLVQVTTDFEQIDFPDLPQPTVTDTTPSVIPTVSTEIDFPDLPQPTVTDTTPSVIPTVSTEIDFPDLPQPTVTPTTPSEMRQLFVNTEQRVNIGSVRNPVLVSKHCYQKAINSGTIQKFILALIEGTFSNQELAESSVIGGKGSYGGVEMVKKRLCSVKINAIFTQAALQFNRPVEDVTSDRTIRNAINSKCRNKKVLCKN